jgi:hypothetical protein
MVIAREREYVAAIALENDRCIRQRKDSMIILVRLRAFQQRDALERRIDLRRRDALLVERSLVSFTFNLRCASASRFFCLNTSCSSSDTFFRLILLRQLVDATLFRRLRIGKIPLEATAGESGGRPGAPSAALDLRVVHGRSELPRQVFDVLRNLAD